MKSQNSDKIFIAVAIFIAFVVYYATNSGALTPKSDQPVDEPKIVQDTNTGVRINDKGQIVYREISAHLRNLDVNYEYSFLSRVEDNPNTYKIAYDQNAILNCINLKCNYIYFSKNNPTALFTDLNNPIFGKVSKFEVSNGDGAFDKTKGCARGSFITYYIDYGAVGLYKVVEDLSVSYKGGDFGCLAQKYQSGDEVVFFIDGLTGVFKRSDIYKAELLDYQFSDYPDTGVKYELVKLK